MISLFASSLRRLWPTEIDALQEEIVALAASHGRHASANAHLMALVREAESSLRTWTGLQLYAELRKSQGDLKYAGR